MINPTNTPDNIISQPNEDQANPTQQSNKKPFFRSVFAACLAVFLVAIALNAFIFVQMGVPLAVTIISTIAATIVSWFISKAITKAVSEDITRQNKKNNTPAVSNDLTIPLQTDKSEIPQIATDLTLNQSNNAQKDGVNPDQPPSEPAPTLNLRKLSRGELANSNLQYAIEDPQGGNLVINKELPEHPKSPEHKEIIK